MVIKIPFQCAPLNSNLGDDCIQNFHLGRYIVDYTVGNLVLRRRICKCIRKYLMRLAVGCSLFNGTGILMYFQIQRNINV